MLDVQCRLLSPLLHILPEGLPGTYWHTPPPSFHMNGAIRFPCLYLYIGVCRRFRVESLMDQPVFVVEKITGKFVLVDKVHLLGHELEV